jgi:hypothetical protein
MNKNTDYQPQKFPHPNTIPSGWDYSGLENASRGQSQNDSAMTDKTQKMETFPKTASFPPGQWDISNLKN